MSTGLECMFIEDEQGRWFYVLQNWDCPVSCWDWREHATATGPFPSKDVAQAHLSENEANPGGWTVSAYDPAVGLDEVERELIANARPPRIRVRVRGW